MLEVRVVGASQIAGGYDIAGVSVDSSHTAYEIEILLLVKEISVRANLFT